MKICTECKDNIIYESLLDLCPVCNAVLTDYLPGTAPNSGNRRLPDVARQPADIAPVRSAYVFEQKRGLRIIINGAVAECQVQQYYQSRFSKIVLALFAGEPYQLSHTSFTTLLRIEELSTRGYPEQSRDVIMHGNVQSIFAFGDDVQVTAKRRGRRLIATRIFNHNTDSRVKIQAHIPANLIRLIVLGLAFSVYLLFSRISLTGLMATLASGLLGLVKFLLPILFVGWIIWMILKNLIRWR